MTYPVNELKEAYDQCIFKEAVEEIEQHLNVFTAPKNLGLLINMSSNLSNFITFEKRRFQQAFLNMMRLVIPQAEFGTKIFVGFESENEKQIVVETIFFGVWDIQENTENPIQSLISRFDVMNFYI